MKFQTIEILNWIKKQPHYLIDLASSGVYGPSTLDGLSIICEDIPLSGDNHYGYLPLREVIADQSGIESNRIAITPDASMANFAILAALLNSGDEAAVELPAYEPFPRITEILTAKPPTRFARLSEKNYHVECDSDFLTKHKPMVLVLTNLHNPTGIYNPPDQFIRLADKLGEDNGWLLVDEVFLPFLPNGETTTLAVSHERIITTNSLTKSWGLGNLRIGWIVAPPSLIQKVELLMDYFHVHLPFIAEYIAYKVLSEPEIGSNLLNDARQRASENWKTVKQTLDRLPMLDYVTPSGGISVFVRFKDGMNANPVCEKLLNEYRVLVVPGRYFSVDDGFHISFGIDPSALHKGLDAIFKVLENQN